MFPVQDKRRSGTKYAGRSRAVVIDNKDPQGRGRIRVKHPLVGETVWIPYLQLPGCFSCPNIEDIVYVEADCGYETHLIAWGNLVKGEEGSPEIPDVFQRINPTNRGFYTKGGHLIEIDDGEDPLGTGVGIGAKIQITSSKGQIFTIDCDTDTVDLTTQLGHEIKMDPTGGVLITTFSGTSANLTDTGITITDVTGNTITTSTSGIKVTEVTGGELNLSQGKVALGGPAAELLALFEENLILQSDILDHILAETHGTGVGPSTPPVNSADFTQDKTKVEATKQKLDLIKGSL